MSNLIKSISFSDQEILNNILTLYISESQFHLDPTYSKGLIYTNIPQPLLKYDLHPQTPDTLQANANNLPLNNNSISSIVFDPPFLFGNHGGFKTGGNIIAKRFSHFASFQDLEAMYTSCLAEFYRILRVNGYLIFKCQDLTDTRTTMTHIYVHNWAQNAGFYAKDLFIKIATGGRIHNPKQKQKHARKFHSYYYVFQKTHNSGLNRGANLLTTKDLGNTQRPEMSDKNEIIDSINKAAT